MKTKVKDTYLQCFGRRVAELRKERGWTQDELACAMGYMSDSRNTTVSKIESGKSNLPVTQVYILTRVFGVSADWLLYGGER